MIYLGWLKFCGTITMAQCQYIGVIASIWDIYQVYCNTREQWLGSHYSHHHASPLWLWALAMQKYNLFVVVCVMVLLTTIVQGQYNYNGVGTPIEDIYQVCCNTREQWLGSRDPQHHAYTPNFGPWLCKNLIYLGWLKLCGAIAMAQVHYNYVGRSSWDIQQVGCSIREQWLGSHDPQQNASLPWLRVLSMQKYDITVVV